MKDLAGEVGMSYTTFHHYASGRSVPKLDFFIALHNFGINLDWFMTGVGEMYRANREDQRAVAYQFADVGKLMQSTKVEESSADTGGRASRLCEFAKWWMVNRSPDDHAWLEGQIKRAVPEYEAWLKGEGR